MKWLALGIAVVALASADTNTQHSTGTFVISDVRVFDGERTLPRRDVVVEAGFIDILHVWRAGVERSAAPAAASIDERAIRHIIADEEDAWNAGDAHAYARHFASDGTFTNVYGRVFEGHDAFERRHADSFSTFFKGSRRRETIRRFKFITPDVAIVDVDTEVRGFGPMPPGVPVIDGLLRTRLEQVFVRHEGGWWIAAYHNVAVAP